ncbi:hypothetical protein YOLOSWAG_37 [Erwinia phage vB_EamM_Yoloswag]|uniref:Uncharacterized protein n=1 Tax=Erwinia phage vB_EamM_Yoloswag TaxID=1958956 RepID=A0A1S6L2W7_9CAUD|nr:hypothetical protein HOR66_gp037 [Erwinia phage vB_EamM_Yoloswag]AQT28522.1 hypothetical protein YOLOSWAG_37 [Erwinia phage vB_EamM_Yoloswag]
MTLSMFLYNFVGIIVAVAVFLLHLHFTERRPRALYLRKQQAALRAVQNGLLHRGQIYEHHSGRKYILLLVTNDTCDDLVKWPVTVSYCDMARENYYSRPLHEFMINMKLCKEL